MYSPKKVLSYHKFNVLSEMYIYGPEKSDFIIDVIKRYPNIPLDSYHVSAHTSSWALSHLNPSPMVCTKQRACQIAQ